MRLRPAAVVLAGGLSLAAAAPGVWAVSRPATAAGPPLAAVVAPAPSTLPDRTPAWPSPPAVHPADPVATRAVPAPVRLVLPSVGIDAPVDPVGVGSGGLMQLPDEVRRVGWYRYGPAPGDAAGAAVLAGHVDSWDQGLGALGRLRNLEPGQTFEVRSATGRLSHWRVVTRRLVVKQQLPLGQLFTRTGPPRLVLLTCGGPFDERLRSYRDNLVVVAEPAR